MTTWRSTYLGGGAFLIRYVPPVAAKRRRRARRITRSNRK